MEAKTVVVGGGIVGLSTALRLLERGRPAVVLEALGIGRQVTGRSTAKITTQHRLIYRELIDTRGFDHASAYAQANLAGAKQIKGWINQYGIECDLEAKAAYAYAQSHHNLPKIEAEAEAARRVGLEAEVLDRAPLPYDTAAALRWAPVRCLCQARRRHPRDQRGGRSPAVDAATGNRSPGGRTSEMSFPLVGWIPAVRDDNQLLRELLARAAFIHPWVRVASPHGPPEDRRPNSGTPPHPALPGSIPASQGQAPSIHPNRATCCPQGYRVQQRNRSHSLPAALHTRHTHPHLAPDRHTTCLRLRLSA